MSDRTRRDFLRVVAGGGLVAGSSLLPGCGGESGSQGATASEDGGTPGVRVDSLTRPLLQPWADDIVRIAAPSAELPVAYVSMALRQVFVDRDFRDRASFLLDAHISVSTWHWRIPLPGDSVGVPIPPGDAMREFEELDIGEWDPEMQPAMDDIRIRRGRSAVRSVDFSCIPLAGVEGPSEVWYSGGPWDVEISDGGQEDTTREDFRIIGRGLRFATRDCGGVGDAAQFVSWAVPTRG